MKHFLLIVMAAVLAVSLISCATLPKNPNGASESKTENASDSVTDGNNDNSSADVKEGKREDIAADKVAKIVTDEIAVDDDSIAKKDWAVSTLHEEYDFTSADEVKDFLCTYVTDPSKYEDTNRILTESNYNPIWSEDRTTFTCTIKFGIGMNVTDILDRMDKNSSSYTAIMKDGSSVHVNF